MSAKPEDIDLVGELYLVRDVILLLNPNLENHCSILTKTGKRLLQLSKEANKNKR